jgi:hypothetical protein
MAQFEDYRWEIHWDTHSFLDEDAYEIASALHNETGTTISLHRQARYALVVDAFIVFAIYYVGKSAGKFFEKLGEKAGERVGDEIGKDMVAIYSKIKGILIEKLKKNKSGKGFQCLFEIYVNGILIRSVFRGTSEEAEMVANSVDSLRQVMEVADSVVDDFDSGEELVEIRCVYDGESRSWTPIFVATSQSVYRIEKLS